MSDGRCPDCGGDTSADRVVRCVRPKLGEARSCFNKYIVTSDHHPEGSWTTGEKWFGVTCPCEKCRAVYGLLEVPKLGRRSPACPSNCEWCIEEGRDPKLPYVETVSPPGPATTGTITVKFDGVPIGDLELGRPTPKSAEDLAREYVEARVAHKKATNDVASAPKVPDTTDAVPRARSVYDEALRVANIVREERVNSAWNDYRNVERAARAVLEKATEEAKTAPKAAIAERERRMKVAAEAKKAHHKARAALEAALAKETA